MQNCRVPASILSMVMSLYATTVLISAPSQAADFPSKAIRIVVPVPPGGSADLVARLIGGKLHRVIAMILAMTGTAEGGGSD